MNTIEAMTVSSKVVPTPYLAIVIDGQPLDVILSTAHPDRQLNGLIPTTLNWMQNESEQNEVWKRFSDRTAKRIVIPILCCPDDLDFSCSVVVVHAKFEKATVQWVQFGLDHTPAHRLPSSIGSTVDWLPQVGPFTFSRDSYETMVANFEQLRSLNQST